MLTEPILSHESEYPFPVVPTVLKLAGQGTSDSADSRARLVLYEPAHSGSIKPDSHYSASQGPVTVRILDHEDSVRYHSSGRMKLAHKLPLTQDCVMRRTTI
ncbi:hypothetical protein M8J77_016083 [Diaphorina citri]|nr:hypothetical protein M8J77_016083 [Diaphorina citri]